VHHICKDNDDNCCIIYSETNKEWAINIPYLGTDTYGFMDTKYAETTVKYCPFCGKKLEVE
jgi:hypothetical protein